MQMFLNMRNKLQNISAINDEYLLQPTGFCPLLVNVCWRRVHWIQTFWSFVKLSQWRVKHLNVRICYLRGFADYFFKASGKECLGKERNISLFINLSRDDKVVSFSFVLVKCVNNCVQNWTVHVSLTSHSLKNQMITNCLSASVLPSLREFECTCLMLLVRGPELQTCLGEYLLLSVNPNPGDSFKHSILSLKTFRWVWHVGNLMPNLHHELNLLQNYLQLKHNVTVLFSDFVNLPFSFIVSCFIELMCDIYVLI